MLDYPAQPRIFILTMTNQSSIITALIAHIVDQCKAVDLEARYDAMLDEIYSFESVGGPFKYMSPSRVLKEMRPTDYRCGCADWSSSEGLVEIEGENYEHRDIETARESFADAKRAEITEKEVELADIEEQASQEDGTDWSEEIATAKAELSTLEAELKEIEDYAF